MADRLPFGQLTPAARPIGAFVSPAREDVAGPAKPQYATGDLRINTIQRASEGNVQGFNQAQQLAEAIAPFNRALTSLLTEGAVALKQNAIESGYYDEIRNQQARGMLSLQMQQEAGAANAAGQITQLERVDPPGAAMLREANPWKAIGRRRALAQLAGGDIDNVLSADLQMNQGQLATVQPGSGALAQRKAQLTQLVLDRYGLTGDEPEAAFYVAPKVNVAWDKYTTQQQKLYNETLRINGRAQVTAAMGQLLQQMGQNGIPLATGEVVPMGDPRFAQLAGMAMTMQLDKTLTFSGGSDRAEDLKEIRTQLLGLYGQVPVLGDALSFIQGGNPGDANRPTWGAAYGLEILETRNRGNAARQQQYELGQKGIEQQLDGLWWAEGSPGSMLPTDPRYAAALINFRNQAAAAGYRDVDSYLKGRMDSQESVVERAYAPDPLASQDFLTTIQDLPRSAMNTPEAVQALREQARQVAMAEPTRELQAARYKEYLDAITARQRQAAETTPGLQQAIDRALLQDLGLPQVKPLVDAAKAKAGGGNAFASLLQGGAGAMAAASGLGNDKITAFTQRLNDLFLRRAEAKIDAWMAERPGVPLTSSARNVLISEAIAETRKSDEYKQAFSALTGKNPGEVGPGRVGPGPSQGTAPGPDVRGVPRASAAALPDTTVKAFAVRPVLNGDWLYSELQSLSKGKPVSGDLYRLANRAGTTTNRYLLEQLRFYPQLDPNGEARKFLEQQIRTQRQGQTVSGANWQGVMGNMIGAVLGDRPAAAATLPQSGQTFTLAAPAPAPEQVAPAPVASAPAASPAPATAPTAIAVQPFSPPQLGGTTTAARPAVPQGSPAFPSAQPAAPMGGGYNPLAPGSWLMNMIMPAAPAASMPVGAPASFDGGDATPGGGIPYVNQRASLSGAGDRECFSATSTMIASAYLGRSVQLSDYNRTRSRYGDSTSIDAQVRALRQMGINASVADNGSVGELAQLVRSGKPVAIGLNHNNASGHWIVVTGVTASGDFIVNDPYGKLRQVRNGGWEQRNSGRADDTTGRGVVYGRAFLQSIFEDRGAGTGRIMRVQGNPAVAARPQRPAGGGAMPGEPQGIAYRYLDRLAYLESRHKNVPNQEGSAGRGYFQAFPEFNAEATAAAGGISPRSANYRQSMTAVWAWIQKYNPRAAQAIQRGDVATADRLLKGTWPSLPGGSQPQSPEAYIAANRYLRGR